MRRFGEKVAISCKIAIFMRKIEANAASHVISFRAALAYCHLDLGFYETR